MPLEYPLAAFLKTSFRFLERGWVGGGDCSANAICCRAPAQCPGKHVDMLLGETCPLQEEPGLSGAHSTSVVLAGQERWLTLNCKANHFVMSW